MEFSAKETTSMKVLHVADDDASLMIERGSFYAARGEDGPVIFRCFYTSKRTHELNVVLYGVSRNGRHN